MKKKMDSHDLTNVPKLRLRRNRRWRRRGLCSLSSLNVTTRLTKKAPGKKAPRAGGTPPPTTSVTGPDYHFVPTYRKRRNT